jgi:hypothetical protein
VSHQEEIDCLHLEKAALHALQMSAQEEMRSLLLLSLAAEKVRARSNPDKECLYEITRVKSELEASQREEVDCLHLEPATEINKMQMNMEELRRMAN